MFPMSSWALHHSSIVVTPQWCEDLLCFFFNVLLAFPETVFKGNIGNKHVMRLAHCSWRETNTQCLNYTKRTWSSDPNIAQNQGVLVFCKINKTANIVSFSQRNVSSGKFVSWPPGESKSLTAMTSIIPRSRHFFKSLSLLYHSCPASLLLSVEVAAASRRW